MKNLCLWLAVTGLLATAGTAWSQSDIRGGWIAETNGARHVYIFKVAGNSVTGIYCTKCDVYDDVSIIKEGRIADGKLAFSVFSQSNGRWSSKRMEGSISDSGILLRGMGSDQQHLVRATRPAPPPAVPAPAAPPVNQPYVSPGPTESLTSSALIGKWISGAGPRAQIFIFKEFESTLVGLVCGPCDNPYSISPIEDGSVAGQRLAFYTVHEDWGLAFKELGPYRNIMTGALAKNQLRLHGAIEGRPDKNVFDMTLIGPMR